MRNKDLRNKLNEILNACHGPRNVEMLYMSRAGYNALKGLVKSMEEPEKIDPITEWEKNRK